MIRDLEAEIDNAARELAERYEEINLLYTISEILGRTVSLDQAASTILREVAETIGARRGAIFVFDAAAGALQPIARIGDGSHEIPVAAIDDPKRVVSRAFRERKPVVLTPGETTGLASFPLGALVAVPILWTTGPGRAETLGAVMLSGRVSGENFTAGDVKLLAAIASQIGSAIQNARLVRESVAQQRLLQEVELAHDLQMKLLPSARVVAPQAEAAARVVPAESVGGDFYHLFRLTPTATGVMIGDVSSHGYRAALIMALAMSASAIHAQSTLDPGAMVNALLQSMREELMSTEMFITLFYGIVDTAAHTLSYANAGHPHAFVLRKNAHAERLGAIDPPLGMAEGTGKCREVPWESDDLLALFTDGMTDALNGEGDSMGERRVLEAIETNVHETPDVIVERVFGALRAYTGDVATRDDLTLVVLRS